MRDSLKALLASCVIVSLAASVAAQQTVGNPALHIAAEATPPSVLTATPPAGPPGTTFVLLPPCRLTNPATDTAISPPPGARHIDIKATRCGRIIPDFAVAYVLRKVTLDKTLPENSRGAGRTDQIVTVPVTSNRMLDFTVPSNQDLSVDIYGYYAAAGAAVSPVLPSLSKAGSGPSPSIMSVGPAHQPRAEQTVSGTTGSLLTDAPFSGFGLALTATSNPSYGWIATQTATSDASSGVAFFTANGTRLFSARSDGAVQLQGGAFLDGRTDFFGSAGAYYGYVSIPTNIIHDVTLIDPRDAAGGATNRVVFYNAQSDDEYTSPPTTKFRASTLNYWATQHINFDSQVKYHWGTFYHYRAYSMNENKDTFWVRAGTNGDSLTSTTADMYVSGNVGIGTTGPNGKLDVMNGGEHIGGQSDAAPGAGQELVLAPISGNVTGILFQHNSVDSVFLRSNSSTRLTTLGANAGTFLTINNSSGNVGIGTSPAAGARLDVQGGNVNVGGSITASGGITATGAITGGTIHASYQDVAEWVPATNASMAAGTVVVVDGDANNTVTTSTHAYDTSVAGVVSPNPGLLLGVGSTSKAIIATTGRVRVRVDATQSPIHKGDLLVTSDRPGMAMRSEPIDIAGVKLHRPGTLIGKALEPLASGEGEILVLLSLQ
jgi:hypothetical protein